MSHPAVSPASEGNTSCGLGLKALVALEKDSSSQKHTPWLTTTYTLSSRGSEALFGLLKAHVPRQNTHTGPHAYTKK